MATNNSITAVKSWLFPSLVSILAAVIWHDVNEIKSDVKALMAQSNIDKTRIDNLERAVFKTATFSPALDNPFPPGKDSKPLRGEMVGVLPDNNLTPKRYETYY
jgi:hypothetical protein